ncbi:carboxylesterase family protein [Macrococcoides bohemicum]|uniref:carboxylesterase family protein n=1 Tax=Macrococcoides bohemicum TaxID=1903056 RepID=UPI00165E37D9|nr:carboxylesterase family protein [Macrococcus bohemicus]MBC9873921.1 carboxylesterase/lipase family protein [Macrococcus bohemicus]
MVETTYEVFKGIKYAEAKRFKKSKLLKFTSINNNLYEKICFQPHNPINELFSTKKQSFHQSEDCLYLNIWKNSSPTEKKPVMIWVHGGGFVNGHGNAEINCPDIFVQSNDCIVVTFNYRLGAFGFLDLSNYGDYDINVGLYDQLNVIKWVNENIIKFGGDPNNITLAGQSAGSMCIQALLKLPDITNYVQKAILMSGVFQGPRVDEMKRIGKDFMDIFKKKFPTKSLDDIEACEILKITGEMSKLTNGSNSMELIFQPMFEENLMTQENIEIPILIGTTAHEGSLYIFDESSKIKKSEFEALLHHVGINNEELLYETFEQQADIITELFFKKPTYKLAKETSNCWVYEFKWNNNDHPIFKKSTHILDLPFLFGHLDILKKQNIKIKANEFKLSKEIMTDWYNMMKFGKLNWPKYSDKEYVKIYE